MSISLKILTRGIEPIALLAALPLPQFTRPTQHPTQPPDTSSVVMLFRAVNILWRTAMARKGWWWGVQMVWGKMKGAIWCGWWISNWISLMISRRQAKKVNHMLTTRMTISISSEAVWNYKKYVWTRENLGWENCISIFAFCSLTDRPTDKIDAYIW